MDAWVDQKQVPLIRDPKRELKVTSIYSKSFYWSVFVGSRVETGEKIALFTSRCTIAFILHLIILITLANIQIWGQLVILPNDLKQPSMNTYQILKITAAWVLPHKIDFCFFGSFHRKVATKEKSALVILFIKTEKNESVISGRDSGNEFGRFSVLGYPTKKCLRS